jgi:hypothetical protein
MLKPKSKTIETTDLQADLPEVEDNVQVSVLDDGLLKVLLPVSQKEVYLKNPTVQDYLEIESKYSKSGNFEQSLYLLSSLIVQWNGKRFHVSVDVLSDLDLEDLKALNDSYVGADLDLSYDITTTESGSEMILFELSDGLTVGMIRPNGKHILETERELKRSPNKNSQIYNMLVMISKLIVRFGELEGEKCISVRDLINLPLSDWGLISAASSMFFRS